MQFKITARITLTQNFLGSMEQEGRVERAARFAEENTASRLDTTRKKVIDDRPSRLPLADRYVTCVEKLSRCEHRIQYSIGCLLTVALIQKCEHKTKMFIVDAHEKADTVYLLQICIFFEAAQGCCLRSYNDQNDNSTYRHLEKCKIKCSNTKWQAHDQKKI